MSNKPFEVQGDINITGNVAVNSPSRVSYLQGVYDEAVIILEDSIQQWETTVFNATGFTIPSRYKVANYTTFDRLVNVSSGWNWTRGWSPAYAEFVDLVFVSPPPANLITQAHSVKQAYSAIQEAQEQYKYIKPQATSGDGARALDITAGTATWSFDLDNTWAQANFNTKRQGRLTLPNGASITSNSAELEAARQAVLEYNAGWKQLCDQQNSARDRNNRLHATDPTNYPNSYTPYFWLNTDVLTTADQTTTLAQLTAMWQAQQSGPVTHLSIPANFYQEMRAFLSLNVVATYEALLASTDITTGNYKFTFRSSDGALVLTEGGAIKSSTDSTIADAQTFYNSAVTAWISLRDGYAAEAAAADPVITSSGWPFIAWSGNGITIQTRLDELELAWNTQTNPSSPPSPLVWTPAISIEKYNAIFNALNLIKTTYNTWQDLQKGIDFVANTTKLSLLADDKLQVPGITQTDPEENLILRTRYAIASSPPGIPLYNNRDWTFGTNGTLKFPDNTFQTTAYVSNITNTAANGAAALLPGYVMTRGTRLEIRTVYTDPNSLNMEFRYNGLGNQVTITANNGTNIFSGTSTGYGTWTRFNPAVFVNPGEKAEVVICDQSYHKIYRVTAIMRDIPTGDNGTGSVYCTIEELK